MAPKKCSKCQAGVTGNRNNPGISCGGSCNGYFHITCANIPLDLLDHIRDKTAAWICDSCKTSKRRSIIDGTESSIETVLDTPSGLPEILSVLNDLRNRIINVENSQQYVSNTFDDFKQQISLVLEENNLLKKKIRQLESKLSGYDTKINKIEAEMDKDFQRSIKNDVVVSGLPANTELKDEIISSLLRALEIKADDSGIQSSFMVNSNEQHRTNTLKKPLLIIKTNSLDYKNNILLKFKNKTKNRNFLRSSDLEINWPSQHKTQNIFIMDHLSPFQTKLYAEAKKIKQKFNLKFLWCKQGKILLRRDSESNIYHINSMNDIKYVEQTFLGPLEVTADRVDVN